MKYKQIKVPEELHRELKIKSAVQQLTIIQLLERLLETVDKSLEK